MAIIHLRKFGSYLVGGRGKGVRIVVKVCFVNVGKEGSAVR